MIELDSRTISELKEIAGKIEDYPVGFFASENTCAIFLLDFWKLANKFVAGIRLLSDERLNSMVVNLNTEPSEAHDAFHLHAKLLGVITVLRNELLTGGKPSKLFVDHEIINELRKAKFPNLDLAKLVRMCEELNECYSRGNYLACALLIRAAMNHVPPVFGFRTFQETTANMGRSVKAAFELLDEDARIVADLHNHATMRSKEPLPTLSQIEQFRASFELLLHEVLTKTSNIKASPPG